MMLLVFYLLQCLFIPSQAQPLRILMIGNSYTYSNAMDSTLQVLLQAQVDIYVQKGTSLYGHWQNRTTRGLTTILAQDWDWIVIQEAARSPIQYNALDYQRFVLDILREIVVSSRASHYLLFQTWGRLEGWRGLSFANMTQQVYDSYQEMAEYAQQATRASVQVAPVGQAFVHYNNTAVLLDADGHHPSPDGSYLAAYTLAASILGTTEGIREYVPPNVQQAPELRQVAVEILQQEVLVPGGPAPNPIPNPIPVDTAAPIPVPIATAAPIPIPVPAAPLTDDDSTTAFPTASIATNAPMRPGSPTRSPSVVPSDDVSTLSPTMVPTLSPTLSPTESPTLSPTIMDSSPVPSIPTTSDSSIPVPSGSTTSPSDSSPTPSSVATITSPLPSQVVPSSNGSTGVPTIQPVKFNDTRNNPIVIDIQETSSGNWMWSYAWMWWM